MGIRRDTLDEVLARKGADPARLQEARTHAERAGTDLISGITRTEAVDQSILVESLAEMTGLPMLHEIDVDTVDPDLVRKIPLGLARDQGILPLWEKDDAVEVAIASPASVAALDDLRVLFGKPVRPFLVAPGHLRDTTNSAFDKASRTASAVIDEIEEEEGYVADDLQLGEDLLSLIHI